jgi:hypothetical protein
LLWSAKIKNSPKGLRLNIRFRQICCDTVTSIRRGVHESQLGRHDCE